ncbi:Retrovirus-related Pol polyprotein from transposon RE1 [Vitis vinifera]|uniref:Retrovirus-related Pol polyprotein from transposon RE1 n=1 Tax=Vitis vinifera TaxID=29760 RepID=A0A438KPR1_VITVI|nr:Retrovirus-related Pol polyprotein from transposon RE1 [Vitis vinifera]
MASEGSASSTDHPNSRFAHSYNAIIESSIHEGVMAQIIGLDTASEIWTALEKIFSGSFKGSYHAAFVPIADNKEGRIETSEQSTIRLVITVTSGHESLSLEEIHSMLLTHENRLEQQHTTEETNLLQANITTMNIQGHNKKKSKVGHSRLKVEEEVALTTILTHLETSIMFLVAAMENHSGQVCDESWYMDTGATHHLTPNLNKLNSHTPFAGSDKVMVGNGCVLTIIHCGFFTNGFVVKDQASKKALLQGNLNYGLYKLSSSAPSRRYQDPDDNKLAGRTSLTTEVHVCHLHYNFPIRQIYGISGVCEPCQMAKSHRLPFTLSESRASQPFALAHSDLWGPAPVVGTNGARYFVLFVDDHTRFSWLYLLASKDQAISAFLQFKVMIETQFDTKVRMLQTDWGGEFQAFTNTLCKFGILHRVSCPSTSQQNGRVERKHRHVVEVGLSLLAHASIPLKYWPFAFQSALYLINRLPSSVLNFSSPYKTLYHCLPNYSFLRVYGCTCYPFLRPFNRHKFAYRSVKCTFIGYSSKHKGYLCLNMSNGKIHISRHVIFDELDFPFAKSSTVQPPCRVSPTHCAIPLAAPITPISSLLPSSSSPSSELVPISDTSVSISSSEVAPIPTAQPSSSHVPSPCHPMTTRAKNGIFKPKIFLSPTETIFHPLCEPNSFKEAVKVPEWQQAMHLEFEALMSNKTWVLVPPPPNQNIIGCRWVYKLKYKPDGTVERYKARLVAKGFHQTPGFDYFETFSPVVKPTTIRVVLSLALTPGFVDPSKPNFVCKLTKALYGLKQAPRAWFTKLSSALVKWGFSMSQADTSMFVYYNNSVMLVVLVYVDDIIVTGSIHGFPNGCWSVLSIADGTRLEDPTLYRSLVGACSNCTITRPDIAYTVNKLCQFMHAPTSTHLQAVKRVLRYLKGSLFYGLSFQPSSSLDLIAYTDADGHLALMIDVAPVATAYFLEAIWSLAPVLYCDNLSTTYLAANPVLHSRAKHVEIDYHFVRERVLQKTLDVRFLPSEDQVADILTKALSLNVFFISEASSQFFLACVLEGDVKKLTACVTNLTVV